MIYKNITELSRLKGYGRQKVYRMIKDKEVKKIYIENKLVGYIVVLDFIKELINDYGS